MMIAGVALLTIRYAWDPGLLGKAYPNSGRPDPNPCSWARKRDEVTLEYQGRRRWWVSCLAEWL